MNAVLMLAAFGAGFALGCICMAGWIVDGEGQP